MSRAEKPKKGRGNVVEMEGEPGGNVAVQEPTPENATPPAPEPAAAPKKRSPSFFERVAAIPKSEWTGDRAFIYVYCLEPICNLKLGGEKKYLVRLSEPIADEQALMVDYGSGKYRLQLVHRKPGTTQGDSTDLTEIEIYNPKYPPKIPRAVWMNDPRNERWAALLPKEEPVQPATGLGTLTDAFKTFTDMRKEVAAELKPAEDANKPQDPLDMAQKILNIQNGANNPMVALFQTQMNMFQTQAEAARTREAELQKELRDTMNRMMDKATAPPAAPKSSLEMLKELANTVKEIAPTFQNLFPQAKEAVEKIAGRSARRSFWEEAGLKLLEDAPDLLKPLINVAAHKWASSGNPSPQINGGTNGRPQIPQQPQIAAPAPNPGQPAAPVPQQPAAYNNVVSFLNQPIVWSNLQFHFGEYMKEPPESDGAGFAQWADESGAGSILTDARAIGSNQIMALLRTSPEWPKLQLVEAKLIEFVDQILSWQGQIPDDDDDDDDETDLTARQERAANA